MRIDPHCHCRDGLENYKETITHVFEIAKQQGVDIIFDMPNTKPPIFYEKDVKKRLKLVPKIYKNKYFLYVGLTSNKSQIREAVKCYKKYKNVIGFKMYAGSSTGNLGVIEERKQRNIYKQLAELGYKGVLAVHCEKEKFFKTHLWNPKKPYTHCLARPKKAEIESIKDQILFAQETGFKGILYIVHVSCHESVEIINKAKDKINIVCGVTPHHILWDKSIMKTKEGLIYKMNPPLRDKKDISKMIKLIKKGMVDFIETDHAPHPLGEKLFPPYASGFPSLYLYKYFIGEFLIRNEINKKLIDDMTFQNIYNTFKEKLKGFI